MKTLTLIITTICIFFFLENCKVNKEIIQNNEIIPSQYCTINFSVIDTNLSITEVVPFVGIADLSNTGNGVDTDINGGAILTIIRPYNNIALFELRYLSLKDTFSVLLNKEEEIYKSYYIPKWFKDSLELLSVPNEIHFVPHGRK